MWGSCHHEQTANDWKLEDTTSGALAHTGLRSASVVSQIHNIRSCVNYVDFSLCNNRSYKGEACDLQ